MSAVRVWSAAVCLWAHVGGEERDEGGGGWVGWVGGAGGGGGEANKSDEQEQHQQKCAHKGKQTKSKQTKPNEGRGRKRVNQLSKPK